MNSADKPASSHVRCADCGAEYRNYEWVPGTPCPKCRSNRFEPVVRVSKASDYESADRSGGFALQDIRFGRLAQWAELITPKQFQRALFQQSQTARQGVQVPDLASLLVRQKAITRREAEAVVSALVVEPGDAADIEFGLAAVRTGLATEADVERCRKIQERIAREGGDPPPLPLLLCEKRVLREAEAVALLKRMEREGKGLIHRIRVSAGAAEAPAHRVARWRTMWHSPAARAGAVAFLLLLAGLVWYRGAASAGRSHVAVRCEHCGAEGGAPLASAWPLECPQCKQKALYPLAVCTQCGERFIVKNMMGYGTACPRCGSTKYKLLTGDVDASRYGPPASAAGRARE